MLCLGIESTAHTFGISLVDLNGTVLSNKRKLFTTESGGLIPAELSDHHADVFDTLIKEALLEARANTKNKNLKLSDINLIAFSQSPGIGNALRIGANVARSLSLVLNVPLIGVNHCIAHLEIGILKAKSEDGLSCKDPILLYASGANTQIIGYEGKKYRIFGETLDNGIGNFLDGFARYIGLGFPGGPKIQELAKKYEEEIITSENKKEKDLIELPYVVKGMDLSFAGIQTKLKQLWDSKKYSKEELCYAVQETAFAMLIEVAERALAHTGKNELLLGGGVACNTRLQEMAKKMCEDRNAKCFILPNEFNVDNAAMIAWTGIIQYTATSESEVNDSQSSRNSVYRTLESSKIFPYLRTDEIEITWRE
ncbi:MAG: KEOPS complex N(6)-L-threonylcarbamoyladenine synthase Kae1 [Candidatus Woesearchaeota archaeon]